MFLKLLKKYMKEVIVSFELINIFKNNIWVELVLKIWWYRGIFFKDVVAPKRAVGFLKNFSVIHAIGTSFLSWVPVYYLSNAAATPRAKIAIPACQG